MYYTKVGGWGLPPLGKVCELSAGNSLKMSSNISLDITNNSDIQVEGLFVSPISVGTECQMVSTQFAVSTVTAEELLSVCT